MPRLVGGDKGCNANITPFPGSTDYRSASFTCLTEYYSESRDHLTTGGNYEYR